MQWCYWVKDPHTFQNVGHNSLQSQKNQHCPGDFWLVLLKSILGFRLARHRGHCDVQVDLQLILWISALSNCANHITCHSTHTQWCAHGHLCLALINYHLALPVAWKKHLGSRTRAVPKTRCVCQLANSCTCGSKNHQGLDQKLSCKEVQSHRDLQDFDESQPNKRIIWCPKNRHGKTRKLITSYNSLHSLGVWIVQKLDTSEVTHTVPAQTHFPCNRAATLCSTTQWHQTKLALSSPLAPGFGDCFACADWWIHIKSCPNNLMVQAMLRSAERFILWPWNWVSKIRRSLISTLLVTGKNG